MKDGNRHINYENVKVLATTTQYQHKLIQESLKIMKNSNNFKRENGYKFNIWETSVRDRQRNPSAETDTTQRMITVTNQQSEEEISYITPVFRNLTNKPENLTVLSIVMNCKVL